MASPAPDRLSARMVAGWAVFCLLMVLVGLQERWYAGEPLWPWPVFYEVSALLVATGVAAWRWRQAPRDDPWLAQPLRWFWRVLRWAPLVALVFVALLYALRHGVRAAFGLSYVHPPWTQVVLYESLKFTVFYSLFAGVQYALRSFQALAVERLRTEQLRRLSDQARLTALTQQMQPHFLFNALNTIASLVHDDAAAAEAALVRLSSLLRAATDAGRRPLHPLADELALARSFADLMLQRFGPERVRLVWQVEPGLTIDVPALSLQPLIENAFVHAVELRRGLTTVTVAVQRQERRVAFTVTDDGAGPRAEWTPGVALSNLQERLHALYGKAATLSLESAPGGGAVARFSVPAGG
jgi:two-component system, LytTR family, sensor kinase